MHKSQVLLFFCIAFILGVAIRSFFVIDFFYFYFLSIIILFTLLLARNNKKLFTIFIGYFFLLLGLWRYESTLVRLNNDFISFYNGESVVISGMISWEPDIRINHTKYNVDVLSMKKGKSDFPVRGKILLTTRLYPQYKYGDVLRINCDLKKPEPFQDFDYERYLARYDIFSLCYYPEISLIKKNQGNFILENVFNLKETLIEIANKSLSEPYASLYSALILGSRRGLPEDLIASFSNTGIIHLISISGSHISLIIILFLILAPHFYISRNKAFYLITFFLIFYLFLIGFPQAAVRAAVMGWFVLLAFKIGRLNNSVNILVLIASILIFLSPRILIDDISFQLSFAAMLGLIYFSPIFQNFFEQFPSAHGVKELIIMTFAAQITTLPLIIHNFEKFSLIAPLTNILVLPLMPLFLLLGFVCLILGFIFSAYGTLIFSPVLFILHYVISIAQILERIPWSYITVKKSGIFIEVFLYIFIVLFHRYFSKKIKPMVFGIKF